MTRKERLSFLRKHGHKKTTNELAEITGHHVRTIQKDLKHLGIPFFQTQTVTDKVQSVRQKQELSRERKGTKAMARRILELERDLEAAVTPCATQVESVGSSFPSTRQSPSGTRGDVPTTTCSVTSTNSRTVDTGSATAHSWGTTTSPCSSRRTTSSPDRRSS